jgi:hypothetical protein
MIVEEYRGVTDCVDALHCICLAIRFWPILWAMHNCLAVTLNIYEICNFRVAVF